MADANEFPSIAEPALAPRRQPVRPKSFEIVARILKAAATIVETEGLPRLNSNRIAEVAKVSVGAIYKFFPSKQAILASVVAEWDAEQQRVVDELARLNPTATFAEQVENRWRYLVGTSASHVLVVSKVLEFYPELRSLDYDFQKRGLEHTVHALRRDGCVLDDDSLVRVAASINQLGSHLLGRVMRETGDDKEELMRWSLMLVRVAIADALRKPQNGTNRDSAQSA